MRTLISILSLLLLTCGLTSAVNLTDLTGCRSNSGLFVPIGSGYFEECNSCTCGENGQSICTLMACTTGACWNDQGKQIPCDAASWFSPLVITTVGDSKINVPSDYAIVRANIESELPVKVKEKESIVIGSGVGSVPATLPALIPAAAASAAVASAAVGATVPSPTPSTSNATVVNATIIPAPPASSNYTDIMTKVQQDVADKAQAVLDYLKKQGKHVWKIETQQVSVYPVYDYTQAQQSIVAYHASISLSFRVTVLHAGTVIDGITAAGVSRIDGVSYGVSDDKLALAGKSAIAEAVENALERAQTALNAAKKEGKTKPTLNPIDINIQSVGTGPNYPVFPIAFDKAVSARVTTPILAEETIVTANVIAKFEAK